MYNKNYVLTDNDQIGQINLSQEELKVRRIGHDVMREQCVVHIGYEADVAANLFETEGRRSDSHDS